MLTKYTNFRSIEAALHSHATRGAGYGNTLYTNDAPVKDKTEYQLPKIKVKLNDDFTNEGVDFLKSLGNGKVRVECDYCLCSNRSSVNFGVFCKRILAGR